MVRKITKAYFNRETEARRELKKAKYGKGYEVRQHPKWHTWDVVKVVKKRPVRRNTNPYNFGIRF